MPRQPRKGSASIYLELPMDLLDEVKAYAERELRSIKSVFVLALRQFLRAEDRSATQEAAQETAHGSAGKTMVPARDPAQNKPDALSAGLNIPPLTDEVYRQLLQKLRDPALCGIAGQLRAGATVGVVLAHHPGNEDAVLKMVNKIKKVLRQLQNDA